MSSAGRAAVVLWAAVGAGCPTPPLDPGPSLPTVVRFEADPLLLDGVEATTTVHWQTQDADVVRLEGGPEPLVLAADGSRALTLTRTSTLTLLASNRAGQVRAQLVVVRRLQEPVRLLRFEVVPPRVRAGDTVVVVWDAPGARAVSIVARGEQSVVLGGPARGAQAYLPLADGVLELSAEGRDGPVTATRSISLVAPPPVIAELTVSPVVGVAEDVYVVRWAALGTVESCTLSAPGATSTPRAGARGQEALAGLAAGRYRVSLRCEGAAGAVESSQDFVVADALAPWIVIDAVVPPVVGAGGTVEVRFRAGGARAWIARTPLDATRVTTADGRVYVVAPGSSFALALEAEQQPGPTATTTVTVDAARPVVIVAAAQDRVGSVALDWRLAQAERVRFVREVGGAPLLDTAALAGSQDVVVPAEDRWLWLEAVGVAGTTRRLLRIEGR